jgi:serine/threonine protein kinase
VEKKPIELPPNAIIGAWKPTTLLGQGGQGAVWAAKPVRVKHTPQRAVKVCFASDDQGRARFAREVETLRRCDSPNILRIYDHDLEWKERIDSLPAFAYYVAEKCQGSMTQRKAQLGDARRRLELFRQACAAVSYLHSLSDPVIHRDIKPDNFLIAQEFGNVVLADFGIARAASDTLLTQAFEIVGTPYYRAPEVLHGARGDVQSDIYGLGRLLEWLFTGEVSTDMATRPVARGQELDDDTCNLLDGVIAKATQVTPAHRFTSVQALSDQLPELWISAKPRPKPGPVLPDTSATTVLTAALELARTSDQLGWRQLQNQLRRDLAERLIAWRTQRERAWPGD